MAGVKEVLQKIGDSGLPFYVYIMRRPDGTAFYIGKGTLDRVACHERLALRPHHDGLRLRIIRSIWATSNEVHYDIVHFQNEADAFREEVLLIALYGRIDRKTGTLANHTDGGEGAANPSEATLKKRSIKLRAVMADPEYRLAAIRTLQSNEPLRRSNARIATSSQAFGEKSSRRMVQSWADPDFREKVVAATRASVVKWKPNHAAVLARVFSDPAVMQKRIDAARSPEANAKRSATMRSRGVPAKMSNNAKAQRERQEVARQRTLNLARVLNANIELPNHRASVATWNRVEMALFAEGVL